jgi:hypothetical protein
VGRDQQTECDRPRKGIQATANEGQQGRQVGMENRPSATGQAGVMQQQSRQTTWLQWTEKEVYGYCSMPTVDGLFLSVLL